MLRLRRPGPAMLVAMFALFIALGGVSVAATSVLLPRNSVGTAQIKNDSVTAAKVAHNSISSVLVKNGTLMAVDFAANQIPAGPQGAKGDTGSTGPQGAKGDTGAAGAQGPRGPSGVMGTMGVAQASGFAAAHSFGYAQVGVPGGKQATGATASWLGAPDAKLGYISLRPDISAAGHAQGYQAWAYNDTNFGRWFTLYVPYG